MLLNARRWRENRRKDFSHKAKNKKIKNCLVNISSFPIPRAQRDRKVFSSSFRMWWWCVQTAREKRNFRLGIGFLGLGIAKQWNDLKEAEWRGSRDDFLRRLKDNWGLKIHPKEGSCGGKKIDWNEYDSSLRNEFECSRRNTGMSWSILIWISNGPCELELWCSTAF